MILAAGVGPPGQLGLRRLTGRYDEGGAANWAEGQLVIDSVRRFKGQAAGAIVLSECDLAELAPLSRRLLFFGLTRARIHEWAVSARTASLLEGALRC